MKTTGFNVGILTALVNPEHLSSEAVLKKRGWNEVKSSAVDDRASIRTWQKPNKGCLETIKTAAIDDMGQAEAALQTMAYLDRAKVDVVFLCGIAGSLNESKYKKEDVVLGKSISWYGFNRLHDGDLFECFRLRPFRVPTPNRDFQTWLSEYSSRKLANRKRDYSLHYADIFTWDYVTHGERATKKVLDISSSAACVEMEAGGFLSAVARYCEIKDDKIPAFVVRGISDYTMNKDKDKVVRQRASENAFDVTIDMIEDFLFNEPDDFVKWLPGGDR